MSSKCALLFFLTVLFLSAQRAEISALPLSETSAPTKNAAGISNPAETQYRLGLASLQKGALAEAEKAFSESLRADPTFLGALLGLADVAVRRGKTEEAGKFLQKALDLAPNNAEVHTAWGRYLYSQKKPQEAETSFKKAISLDSKAVSPRVDLGTLYAKSFHQPEKAIESFRQALALDPSLAGAHFALGSVLVEVGKFNEAKTHLEEAARLDAGNPMPWVSLGNMYTGRKEYDKALQAFARADKVKPGYAPALLGRGDVFTARKEYAKALAAYSAILKGAPKFAPAWLKTGMVHQLQGNFAQARKAYLEAVAIDSSQALAYNNLAFLSTVDKQQLDKAVVWAQNAVTLGPDTAQFQDTLGWVYRAKGDLTNAARVLEKAAAIKPPQAEVYYHLGVVYAESGKAKDAEAAFRKALSISAKFNGADDAKRRLAKSRQAR